MADAIDRDLRSDRLAFDELGWRGLWAYILKAPPHTAIHYAMTEGWSLGDKIAAEQLYEERKLNWRYTAIHFEGGRDYAFPEPIEYPGAEKSQQQVVARTWQTVTVEELLTPEVKALLQDP